MTKTYLSPAALKQFEETLAARKKMLAELKAKRAKETKARG